VRGAADISLRVSDIRVGIVAAERHTASVLLFCFPLYALTELVDNASNVSSVHITPATNAMRTGLWRGHETALDQMERIQRRKQPHRTSKLLTLCQ
jgi:hypothetical protein